MSEVEKESADYYLKALQDGSHTAYLVFDGKNFIGAGGISYYRVMPTFHNVTGKKAYIMNMYTHPEYRRKGIAFIAAAIGDDKPNIERIYGDAFLDITDLSQLPVKLTAVVKRHIQM